MGAVLIRAQIAVIALVAAAPFGCGSGHGSATPGDGGGAGGSAGQGGSGGGGSGGGGGGGGRDTGVADVPSSDGPRADGPSDGAPADVTAEGGNRDLRAERPTEGTTCHTQEDCVGGVPSFLFCVPPDGPSLCGIPCPRQSCQGDGDCAAEGGRMVCDLSNGPRGQACCSGARICQPACAGDQSCLAEESCDPNGHCVPRRCQRESDCPAHFTCPASGVCTRRACTVDTECAGGFCVARRCYAQPGTCRGPAP